MTDEYKMPEPLKLASHELALWTQVYAQKISQTGSPWAALRADEAVLELRKRYDPSITQGPYR